MGLHGQLGHVEGEEPGEQRLGAVVAAAELGDGGQAVQHQGQLARPVEGEAELVGPGVGRVHLGGGEALGGDQGRAERHPRGQLRLVPLGPLGQARQELQQGPQVLDGLDGGAAPQRLHGGGLEVGDGPGVVVAGDELGGQLGRVRRRVRPVGPFQPLAGGGVQPRPPAGRDAVVQHGAVEVVREPEPRRHRPVRPGHRAGGPQEAALAGEGRAAPLDRLDGPGPVAGGRRGGELGAGDGGRLQHAEVLGVQPLQLELEQAAEVVRDLAVGAVGAGRQLPAPGRRPQDPGVGPGLGELDDEQRHPVGAPVHQLGPGRRRRRPRGGRAPAPRPPRPGRARPAGAPRPVRGAGGRRRCGRSGRRRRGRRPAGRCRPPAAGPACPAWPATPAGRRWRGRPSAGPRGPAPAGAGRRRPPGPAPPPAASGPGSRPAPAAPGRHGRRGRPAPAAGPARSGRAGTAAPPPRRRRGTAGRGRRRPAGTARARPAAPGTARARPAPPGPARPRRRTPRPASSSRSRPHRSRTRPAAAPTRRGRTARPAAPARPPARSAPPRPGAAAGSWACSWTGARNW